MFAPRTQGWERTLLAETLRTVYGFDSWATGHLLDSAAELTQEQLLLPGSAGQGSVRDTLLHLLSAQRNWLGLCDGSLSAAQAFSQALEPADYPDVAALRTVWREIDAATRAYLSRVDEAELVSRRGGTFPWNNADFSQPVWAILLHVANHNTQHRSEAAALLTEAGRSPGHLDLLGYTLGWLGAPTLAA